MYETSRFYHRTSTKESPEWLASMGVGFKSLMSCVTDPIFLMACSCSFIGCLTVSSYLNICSVMEIVNIYNQICLNVDLVHLLETTYPVLNEFNENAARFVERKACGRLTYEDCQLIIKYSIRYKNNIILRLFLLILTIFLPSGGYCINKIGK